MAIENPGLPHPRRRHTGLPAEDDAFALDADRAAMQLSQPETRLSQATITAVRLHLERLLQSDHFDAAGRSREFLKYVVEEVIAGRGGYLKQATIAVDVFGRRPDFDAVIDPIVRVQAGRLRRSLERYYLLAGDAQPVRIELPKGSYAPVFVESADEPAPRVAVSSVPQAWPAVVVHPFEAHSTFDRNLATHLGEELTSELCRYGIVHVIRMRDAEPRSQTPHPAARFELNGVALDTHAQGLFAARLVDRVSGLQIWADEFHPARDAVSGLPSAKDIGRVIAARVGNENGVITRLLAKEFAARHFPAAEDFSAIARHQHFLCSRQRSELLPAVEALQQLTQRSPETELAWTSLARLYLMNHAFELTTLFTPVEMAIGCANQSVLLEPASARTRCLMASALLVKGELGAARRELDLALRLNSDSLAYREVIGWLLALAGEWDSGVALMRSALDRNPYCQPCVSHGLWANAMRLGDFESAYASALDYREPGFFWRELMIASSLGRLGRIEEARTSAAELLRVKPQFAHRGRRLIAHYIKDDKVRSTIVEGLEASGIAVA